MSYDIQKVLQQGEGLQVEFKTSFTEEVAETLVGFIRVRKAIADYPTMKFEYSDTGYGFLTRLSYTEQKISSTVETTVETILKLIIHIILITLTVKGVSEKR